MANDTTRWKLAGRKFSPSVLRRVQSLVQSNHHTEAYTLAAEELGDSVLAAKLSLVSKLQKLEGHLPRGLYDYQYALYQEMVQHAKQVLDEADYRAFYAAF